MCNGYVKGVSNLKRVAISFEQGAKRRWWIKSKNENDGEAKSTKRSEDLLKSNMKGSHICNECNDGRDNGREFLREGRSSHSQNTRPSEYKKWRALESSHTNSQQQTYYIKWTSNINIHTQWWRMLCTYTHVLIFLFFSFIFIFLVIHLFFIYLFFTYIQRHTPWT